MEDKQVKQVETQAGGQVETPKEVKPEIDYKSEYETYKQLTEKLKSDNAGLDRKISELSNAQKEILTKYETESEKKDREKAEDKARYEADKLKIQEEKTLLEKEKTKWSVERKALELKLDIEEINDLGFTTVEQVEKYAKRLEDKAKALKEEATKNLETALSGDRTKLTLNTKGATFSNEIEKAFK